MSDFLATLAKNSGARKVLGSMGLPLPSALRRDQSPWRSQELADANVLLGFGPKSQLANALAETLAAAGANPFLVDTEHQSAFMAAGEAWGRPPQTMTDSEKVSALILDVSGISDPAELRSLYDFFHPRLRSLAASGRAIVLGRPPQGQDLATDTARRALEGFMRALGRELGRFGSTAMLISIAPGAEDRLNATLRFLLSPRSAFVSGQVWHLSAQVTAATPQWQRPLEGKTILVTGAARGIGAATATALAREGARVLILDLPSDEANGQAVAAACKGLFLPCDLSTPEAAAQVAERIQSLTGRLHGVIHNAGVTRDKTLANMPPELWDLTLNVNLSAVLRLQAALDPLLVPEARVVCLSSIAGIAGNLGQTNYAASKAGIIGFVQGLAAQLANRGIAVNAIAPGFIETRMTAAIPMGTREVARRLSNLAQGGLPEDIAEVAVFLMSPGASGLSGQVLRVCGGSFIGA